jgi:cytochrome P450
VSYLFDQEIDGEPISDEAMAKMLLLLLVAGIDTTWSALGASFWHLANHDDDRQRLVDDPSLIPVATEELLRAYGPVTVARIATKDTELGGCPVAAGEWVMLNLLAANRDPEVFDDPDEVIIDRTKNRHAAFGLGVHRCLGSNLARIEMHIAIEMLLERYPNFSAVPGADPEWSAGTVRGPRSVPVILS